MYLLIRYPVGVIVEGVVLANGKNRMRVAVAGFPDTMEFTRSGQQWFAAGQPVEFDCLLSVAKEGDQLSSSTQASARANAAAIPH